MIRLGDRVRDRITGFTGVATARHEYLSGCVRYTLDGLELKDGKPIDDVHFDEQRLEMIPGENIADQISSTTQPGGPGSVPGPRKAPIGL